MPTTIFSVPQTTYWSATTSADDPTAAWGVDLHSGDAGPFGKPIFNLLAWCVRGGMNADQY